MNLMQMLPLFIDSRRRGMYGARRRCSEKTIKIYRNNLQVFLAFMAERSIMRFEDLNRVNLSAFFAALLAKQQAKEWSESTRLQVLRTMRAFLHWIEQDPDCVDDRLDDTAKKLLRHMPPIPKNPRRDDIPKMRDIRGFQGTFNTRKVVEHRDYVASCLMMDNGMRIGELCNLRLNDIDWDIKIATVCGKTGRRNVPLSAGMIPLLKGWIKRRRELKSSQNSDYVFVSARSPKMSPDAWASHIARHRKKHGLPRISAHSFRHLFCTNYLAKGGDMNRLMNITGHTSYQVIGDYLHQAKLAQKESRDEFEKVTLLKEL
jgi:site-specific recombinase XerD